jgi:aryl-alcohol dehydrogenase-like predicted oxidoreductase
MSFATLNLSLISEIIHKSESMEYIKLGKSELVVSRLCVGTWQAAGWAGSDPVKFNQIIRRALELGINFFDTAESYGDGIAEEQLSKALQRERQSVFIATKFSHKNATPEKARKSLEDSLRRLKTDYIDLYQYHWPSPTVPLRETLEVMQTFKKEGKIRAIGVSNWNEPEWDEFDDTSNIDTLQNCYSLLWRGLEKRVLPFCNSKGVTVLAYSPLAQGILADQFSDIDNLPKDPRRQNKLLSPDIFPKTKGVLAEIRKVSQVLGKPMNQIALRWLLEQPGVGVAIIGGTKAEQLESNFGALGWKLDSKDTERLSEVTLEFSAKQEPHDTLWGWHSRGITKAIKK